MGFCGFTMHLILSLWPHPSIAGTVSLCVGFVFLKMLLLPPYSCLSPVALFHPNHCHWDGFCLHRNKMPTPLMPIFLLFDIFQKSAQSKGAGYFHTASQRKEGTPSIRFMMLLPDHLALNTSKKLLWDPYLSIHGKILSLPLPLNGKNDIFSWN